MNVSDKFAAGAPNPFGRLPDSLYVFSKYKDSYVLSNTIEIDPVHDIAFSSTLGYSRDDGVAWNEDETKILVTAGLDESRYYIQSSYSDIYLVDLTNQTFKNLTDDVTTISLLPQWVDSNNISFVRYDIEDQSKWDVHLIGMNLETGEENLLSVLSDDGRIFFIEDYAIVEDIVYFCDNSGNKENMGLYRAKLDGGRLSSRLLLGALEMREDGSHPYVRGFYSVQVSSDERWALLTVIDHRLQIHDFPFADGMNIAKNRLDSSATQKELEEAAKRFS